MALALRQVSLNHSCAIGVLKVLHMCQKKDSNGYLEMEMH